MNPKQKDEDQRIQRLLDAMVADVATMSDQRVLEELKIEEIDPDEEFNKLKSRFDHLKQKKTFSKT